MRYAPLFLCLACWAVLAWSQTTPTPAPAPPDINSPAYITALMRKVADWRIAYTGDHLDVSHSNEWWAGAFRDGVTALYRVTGDEQYYKSNVLWGEATGWKLHDPDSNPDDQCCGQSYCETYLLKPTPEHAAYYAATKATYDRIVNDKNTTGAGWWNWEDSLFMSPSVLAMLGKITGDRSYYDALANGWDSVAGSLYDTKYHLWYFRNDPHFKTTPKGNPQFWGPGNAWVLAGLTRCLLYTPESYERRSVMMGYYKDMCDTLRDKQQPDGFWRTSLYEPTEYPTKEASCTAFFTYAMGMGVANGWLDAKTYLPVVNKGWAAITTAVDDKGKVGYCEPWSNAPFDHELGADANTPEGSGAVLLAGEAMFTLAQRPGITGE